jgi:anti-sigma28 factor (negative regulator of flagellin synthesis)
MIDLTQLKTAEQKAAEAAQQQREQRIAELKQLLTNSDYKVLPDYDKDSEAIKAQRQAWREEIRTLEAQA